MMMSEKNRLCKYVCIEIVIKGRNWKRKGTRTEYEDLVKQYFMRKQEILLKELGN